jgi:hypothetical protein
MVARSDGVIMKLELIQCQWKRKDGVTTTHNSTTYLDPEVGDLVRYDWRVVEEYQ